MKSQHTFPIGKALLLFLEVKHPRNIVLQNQGLAHNLALMDESWELPNPGDFHQFRHFGAFNAYRIASCIERRVTRTIYDV